VKDLDHILGTLLSLPASGSETPIRNTADVHFEYADEAPPAGEAYYYVRLIQSDGEMAWGSPAWVLYPR
jgi:hypothetical protein